MVFEVRDLWPEVPAAMGALRHPLLLWAARRLERFAYTNAARVVALSPGMAEGVVHTGYPSARTRVIPNGSDLELFRRDPARGRALRQRLGFSDDQIVVGYTGTLGRANGVGYLVQLAAALQADARFVFLCVGDGHEREQVAALARELGALDRNFHLIAQMPKTEMPAVLSALDVATSLFVPIRELESNSANKFFDALAAGCCVAINYGGWQADLLREAGAGIQLPRDPEQAARELQALANEPGKIKSCGENARRLAEQRFSRDELAARVEAVVAEAVAERRERNAR
jgi:glycosyltransferase involved in cell wall biosynthesis